MTRVILARDVAQVDAPSGRRYGGNVPGRVFDMTDADAKAVVKLGGAMASLAAPARRGIGFRCKDPECDFRTWTRKCGRCGGECERE